MTVGSASAKADRRVEMERTGFLVFTVRRNVSGLGLR
jgi:hypothetical protein